MRTDGESYALGDKHSEAVSERADDEGLLLDDGFLPLRLQR